MFIKNPRTLDDLIVHLNNDGKDGQQLFRNIEENFRYVCKAMDPYLYQSENIKEQQHFNYLELMLYLIIICIHIYLNSTRVRI